MQVSRFEVYLRYCASLAVGAQLGRLDDLRQVRHRQHDQPSGRRQPAHGDGQTQSGVRAENESQIRIVGPAPPDLAGERDDPRSGVVPDVTPVVAVHDRGYQQPDWQRKNQRVRVPGSAHGEVGADHGQRAHQYEDHRYAEALVLVLERRRSVRVAAHQAEDSEGQHSWAAQNHEIYADGRSYEEETGREGASPALGESAFEHRLTGTRRSDGVDALSLIHISEPTRPY